jgi:hypothetical protein
MNINGIFVDQVALAWSLADSARTRPDASEARPHQRDRFAAGSHRGAAAPGRESKQLKLVSNRS